MVDDRFEDVKVVKRNIGARQFRNLIQNAFDRKQSVSYKRKAIDYNIKFTLKDGVVEIYFENIEKVIKTTWSGSFEDFTSKYDEYKENQGDTLAWRRIKRFMEEVIEA